jgi:hypothetical protein
MMIYGGGKFDSSGVLSIDRDAVNFLAENWVMGQNITDSAKNIIGSKATDDEIHQRFRDAFVALADAGHMPGVPVSAIDEWNGQVKFDLRFSDSTAIPFQWERPFMTTFFLSSDAKAVYPVRDGFLMCYKDNMGALGAPKGLPRTMFVDGVAVEGQEFDNGTIIFDASSPEYYGRAGESADRWGDHNIPYGRARKGEFF